MATTSNIHTTRFLTTTSCQCIGDEDFTLIVWPKENNYSILKKSKCPKEDENCMIKYKERNTVHTGFIFREGSYSPLQVPEREEEELRQDDSKKSFESVLVYEREDESINLLSLEADINYLKLFVTLLMDVIYKNADEVINLDLSTIAHDQGYQLIKGTFGL
ncbi:unnamed protein product, partial [Didymodactylos carnosus]